MSRCSYCGYLNSNRYYCAGCGRRLGGKAPCRSVDSDPRPFPFLVEIIAAIDRVFPPTVEEVAVPSGDGLPGADLARIAPADEVMIEGDARFCLVKGVETARLFFGEVGVGVGVALLFALLAHLAGGLSVLVAIKLYFVVFVVFSWVVWWFFPLVTEGTPVALTIGETRLSRETGASVRGDFRTATTLWLFSLGYSLVPLVLAEYLYYVMLREHYLPLLFHLTGVRAVRPA